MSFRIDMLPKINNKTLLECDEKDLEILISNPDYAENQYLEYKKEIDFIISPKDKKGPLISEYRNDICSFANALGGYIIYGISEKMGVASALFGVEIESIDQFELDLRNKLAPIFPKTPPLTFRFIPLSSGRWIVILLIEHDYYAPYVHIEDEKNYKIYKRDGNRKTVVNYMELKNMFIQSQDLERKIADFRRERIDFYHDIAENKYKHYILFHIIPETFTTDQKNIFVIERKRNTSFKNVFRETNIDLPSIPCVDGLKFRARFSDEEGVIYDTGIAEYVLSLERHIDFEAKSSLFPNEIIWLYIYNIIIGYKDVLLNIYGKQRYYACISIVGCKDIPSECSNTRGNLTRIDRDEIICAPIVFEEFDDILFDKGVKNLKLEYLLSLGIRNSKEIDDLIDQIE